MPGFPPATPMDWEWPLWFDNKYDESMWIDFRVRAPKGMILLQVVGGGAALIVQDQRCPSCKFAKIIGGSPGSFHAMIGSKKYYFAREDEIERCPDAPEISHADGYSKSAGCPVPHKINSNQFSHYSGDPSEYSQ